MEHEKHIRNLILDIVNQNNIKKTNDFFSYLASIYRHAEYSPNIAYIEYPNRELFKHFIVDLKRCTFLNKIPRNDWEINIYKILKWGQKYFREPIFEKMHERRDIKRERNMHINKFEEAKKVLELFIPQEKGKNSFGENINIVDYGGTPIQDTLFMKELHNSLSKAINDIREEKFHIFPREYYFGSKASTRGELGNLLQSIAAEYNITPYSDDIKHIKALLKIRRKELQ